MEQELNPPRPVSACCKAIVRAKRNDAGTLFEYFFCTRCNKKLDQNTLEVLIPVSFHEPDWYPKK